MRLRRETGDFNLVFDWTKEQYTCQIRKGLGVEELVGAIVTVISKKNESFPTVTDVAPIIDAAKLDGDATISGSLYFGGESPRVVVYDPETGIATFRPRV